MRKKLTKEQRAHLRVLRKALDLPARDLRPGDSVPARTRDAKGADGARRRRWATRSIDRYRDDFRKSGKALFAWLAFLECHDAGLRLPDWLLDYFEVVARNLLSIGHNPPLVGKVPPNVATATGFSTGGFPAALKMQGYADVHLEKYVNPFELYDTRGLELAAAVWTKAAVGKSGGRDAVWHAVSKEKKVSYSTVRRAWVKHGAMFDLSITNCEPELIATFTKWCT